MIFHVMISASLLEGATHHFCFFCIFQADRSASKLLSLVVFWVYSDCCLHPFSHCQKMARVKITILEMHMWRFPKTGVPQIIDFQRIFHSKPSSDPHWNPRWIHVILTQKIGPEGTSRRTSRAWRRGGSFRTLFAEVNRLNGHGFHTNPKA